MLPLDTTHTIEEHLKKQDFEERAIALLPPAMNEYLLSHAGLSSAGPILILSTSEEPPFFACVYLAAREENRLTRCYCCGRGGGVSRKKMRRVKKSGFCFNGKKSCLLEKPAFAVRP